MRRILQGRRVAIGAIRVELVESAAGQGGCPVHVVTTGNPVGPACKAGLNLPDDGADHVGEKPGRGQSRQASNVGGRIEFDEVEPCDPGPLAEAAIRSIACV